MPNLPVACTLDAATLRTRKEGLLAALVRRATRRDATATGLRLEFGASSETLALAARVIDAERRCCRFLQFQLTVEPDEGPIVLDVRGPEGSREFLDALLNDSTTAD